MKDERGVCNTRNRFLTSTLLVFQSDIYQKVVKNARKNYYFDVLR
jgi:hypothetical protein